MSHGAWYDDRQTHKGKTMETSDISSIIADSGFIIVENPQENNLKPRVPTKNSDELYSVTIFHQLHCLVFWLPFNHLAHQMNT